MSRLVDGVVSIELRSDIQDDRETLTLVFGGEPGAQYSVGFYHMNESGPTSILEMPLVLDANGEHYFQIRFPWPDGLYSAHIAPASNPSTFPRKVDPMEEHAFRLGIADGSLEEAVRVAVAAQYAFQNREIRASEFIGDNRFIMHVVIDKCNLDYDQKFEGGKLHPMGYGLGPQSILAAVDRLLTGGVKFSGDQTITDVFAREHPLCLVSFVNVQAANHRDAIRAVQTRLGRVLGALAEDRMASPEPLAYLSESTDGLTLDIAGNVYQGNMAAGFGPGVTGLLDLIEAGARTDPWIDFALRLMRSIRTQTNQEARLFQAWSLIEAAAKRRVPSNSQLVLDDNGAPIATGRGSLDQSRDVGRVIIYLRDHVGRNILPSYALPLTFFEQVRLIYDCRNRIAHEGGISAPTNPPPSGYTPLVVNMVVDWAAQVLRYECRKAAGI